MYVHISQDEGGVWIRALFRYRVLTAYFAVSCFNVFREYNKYITDLSVKLELSKIFSNFRITIICSRFIMVLIISTRFYFKFLVNKIKTL